MGIVRKFIEFVRNKIITRRGFAPGTITKIMAKYILSKKAKGKKYQYTVTDEKGNVISTRTSARDYVACTANGEFYFGRLDLIGKGDHGKGLSRTTEILANPERAYKKQVAYFVPSYRKEWIAENPADEWIARNVNWATERQKRIKRNRIFTAGGITPALPVMDIRLTEEQREILSGRICPSTKIVLRFTALIME